MKSQSESQGPHHRNRRILKSLELNALVTGFGEKRVFKVRGQGGEFLSGPTSEMLNVYALISIIQPTLKYLRDAK